jgi:hypothetical protein
MTAAIIAVGCEAMLWPLGDGDCQFCKNQDAGWVQRCNILDVQKQLKLDLEHHQA